MENTETESIVNQDATAACKKTDRQPSFFVKYIALLIPLFLITIVIVFSSLDGIIAWFEKRIEIARLVTVFEFSNHCSNRPAGEVILPGQSIFSGNNYVILKGEKSVSVYSDMTFQKRIHHVDIGGKVTNVWITSNHSLNFQSEFTKTMWDFGGYLVAVTYKVNDGTRLNVFSIGSYWDYYTDYVSGSRLKNEMKAEMIGYVNKELEKAGIKERLPLEGKPVDISTKFTQVCDLSLGELEFVGIHKGILTSTKGGDGLQLLDKHGEVLSRLDFGAEVVSFVFNTRYDDKKLISYNGRNVFNLSINADKLTIEAKIDTGFDGDITSTKVNMPYNGFIYNSQEIDFFNGVTYFKVNLLKKKQQALSLY